MHLQRSGVDKGLSPRRAQRAEQGDRGDQGPVGKVDARTGCEEAREQRVAGCIREKGVQHVVDLGLQHWSEATARDGRVNRYAVIGVRIGIGFGFLRSRDQVLLSGAGTDHSIHVVVLHQLVQLLSRHPGPTGAAFQMMDQG